MKIRPDTDHSAPLFYLKRLSALCFIALLFAASAQSQNINPVQGLTRYVDPRIGTKGGGHSFPGVSLPMAMVKLGPDCDRRNANSGYTIDGNIWGFSHTHVSGTGGGCKYGNVLIGAGTGKVDISDYSSPRKNEQIKAGYYSVELTRFNVRAELTASERTGFHKYTFPKSDSACVLVDLGSILGEGVGGEKQTMVESEIKVISGKRIEGYTTAKGGWNKGGPFTVYFSAEFDTPYQSFNTWKDGQVSSNSTCKGIKTGAFFYFKTKEKQSVKLKVGISFISTAKARQNLQNEISGWDFEGTRQNAINKWNKYLNAVEITGNDERKTIFYTALYHALLMPTNRTGENPLWSSTEPYYDDYYAIWDTFRATNPLLTLLYPNVETDVVRSLVNIYQHEGYMPDARSGNYNGRTQGGSNSDMLIADAYVKGLKGIDYKQAYQGMLKNAEVPYPKDAQKQGRGGIEDYNTIGYVSTKYERSGSRTVEYANNDYAIAVVANALGKHDDYLKYSKRASNWVNLWKPITHLNFKGFIMPKTSDGAWDEDSVRLKSRPGKKFDVLTVGSWRDIFYEAHSWEYSLYVPQDVKRLIDSCGGKQTFIARLDTFFNKPGYFNINNEPGFLTPSLYNYAGVPFKTAQIVHRVLRENFKNAADGLPGNDDAGATSSWFIFHALGLYPNTGQDVYLISTPLFPKVVMRLANGKSLVITATNLSEKNLYIKSARLNGRVLNNSWFKHTAIKNGGTLTFMMTDKPTGWAANGVLPPSMSDR